jgi:hypothetical protein
MGIQPLTREKRPSRKIRLSKRIDWKISGLAACYSKTHYQSSGIKKADTLKGTGLSII